MKRILLAILLSLCCLYSFGQIRITPREKLDSIALSRTAWCEDFLEFDTLVLDAGIHAEDNGIITGTFNFKNTGKEIIQISKVQTSCTCIAASPSRNLVPPGSKAQINVSYDPKGHPGIHPRYIHLYTKKGNDEEELAAIMIFSTIIE